MFTTLDGAIEIFCRSYKPKATEFLSKRVF